MTTQLPPALRRLCALVLLALLVLSTAPAGWCADPAAPVAAAAAESNAAPDMIRAYLQVQEQIHATQLAIERNKQDSEEVAAKNAIALAQRLESLEKSLGEERSRSQTLLLIAAVFCVVGVVAMLATSFMQMRTMNRLAESAFNPNLMRASLAAGATPRLLEQDNANNPQLLATIDRLEKRLRELEGTPRPTSPPALEVVSPDGHTRSTEATGEINTLLGKGQALLNQGQAEAALAVFDQALALDARHAEALIKKGAAFEKLQKFDDALACYDRAIAADNTVTIAYLYKGGIYNRLERYTEALACYEQALKTQEKAHAA